MRRFALVLVALLLGVVLCGACGNQSAPARLITHFDAGSDAAADVAAEGTSPAGDDDASPFLGGPCVDDPQCNDGIPCTYDSCDRAAGRCLNVPDDTQCDDGVYCDGKEQCVPARGCQPGPVVDCSSTTPCMLARCVEASKSCAYTPRDVDQDGDPDGSCAGGHDCNDLDPDVSSLHAEVCGNGVDDNCNGLIDENPCVVVNGQTCSQPAMLPGPGTYNLSTVGANGMFTTSCGVSTPAGAQNVVAAVIVPPGPAQDLEVWAQTPGPEVAVAIEGACGLAESEYDCGSGKGASNLRARARSVGPGTYYVVVTTQSPTPFVLQVSLLPPTTAPTNVDCATATPIQPSTPVTVSIVDPPSALPSACSASTGALTYAFSLTEPHDVRVYATTLQGSGQPVVGLRDAGCTGATDELGCLGGGTIPLYARALPAGTYTVTVAATAPSDVNLHVELSPPSAMPADQSCAAPPAIAANGTVPLDFSNHEEAIHDGCFSGAPNFVGGPTAAYDVSLPVASDVLLIERIPNSDHGAVSLDAPACDASSMIIGGCTTGTTPIWMGRRNVAAGDYRAVVADWLSLQGSLDALVRPTIAPTILPTGSADACAAPFDISAGGFFMGDTSKANADYGNPCDAPTSPPNGAKDQVLSLTLAQPQRVVFDMEGSTYTTILDVRQGSTCPGISVNSGGGCYVGFGPQRSFLDLDLAAGQYWVIIDGYATASGPWDLDVRVLPPRG